MKIAKPEKKARVKRAPSFDAHSESSNVKTNAHSTHNLDSQGSSTNSLLADNSNLMTHKIDKVVIRMYCMGTGDCFVLKFLEGEHCRFTLMIDCGSCRGRQKDFIPYIQDLVKYAGNVDLLIVTHEHNDHVNGFDKCEDLFEKLVFKEAWMAWTENPDDPDGAAQDLLHKREHMRLAFSNAINKVENNKDAIKKEVTADYYNRTVLAATTAFFNGLDTLGEINLAAKGAGGAPLPGMVKIKNKLKKHGVPIRYLYPGETRSFPQFPGVKFHALGPPLDKKYVYKEGKQGKDVFKKHFSIGESLLVSNAFSKMGQPLTDRDLPFGKEYVLDEKKLTKTNIEREKESLKFYLTACHELLENYKNEKWRKIENEWLYAAGSLALRLNSHINNTSLALALEFGKDGNVILLPGDAEFGSWESWHMIEKWKGEGKNGKHFTEDLLNRTIFYKVGHHLSYNGTALEKGIQMMNHPELAVMATLDRTRISSQWKSTMPNIQLLKELITRSKGRCFIMDETEIQNPPSKMLDPKTLGSKVYHEERIGGRLIYKQYVVNV